MSFSVFDYATTGFEAARTLATQPLHGHSFKLSALVENTHIRGKRDLKARLDHLVTDFDYQCLNDLCDDVSDIGLLSEIYARVPELAELRLQSAPGRGVLCYQGQHLFWLQDQFSAAHFLPHVPQDHKCHRLHGHHFKVTMVAGRGVAWAQLRECWQRQKRRLDNAYLNALPNLGNPTSESLAVWLWQNTSLELDGLTQIIVQETPTSGCIYDGKYHRIWIQQEAETAVYIPTQYHPLGKSYTIRIYLQARLDCAMGWVLDYSEIKRCFSPLYQQLDHHCINELMGKQDVTASNIANWIYQHTADLLPSLYRVDVLENGEKGVFQEFKPAMIATPRLVI